MAPALADPSPGHLQSADWFYNRVLKEMRSEQGYEILHNGVPRTFRDRRATALDAARFAKNRAKGDVIELRDCAIG